MSIAVSPISIADLRAELGLSLEAFAARLGVSSKGRMSEIERGLARPTAEQALAIEGLAGGRIDAAALHPTVAAARSAEWKLAPGEIDALADQRTHDATSAIDDCADGPASGWEEDAAEPHDRVVICCECDRPLDDITVRACQARDCPHAQREAA